MTNEEIIRNHAQNNSEGGNYGALVTAINEQVEKGAKILKFNDVLFVFNNDKTNALFAIINGGGPKQYLNAVQKFIAYMSQKGIQTFLMYVADMEQTKKIANAVGLSQVEFEDTGNASGDKYLMIARP